MLNERIRDLRISHGLTQVDLSKALNVTKQCVSNWENNNIQPSIDMLVKLARYFSVSTDYILCLDDRKTVDVSRLSDAQAAHIRQLVKDIYDLL